MKKRLTSIARSVIEAFQRYHVRRAVQSSRRIQLNVGAGGTRYARWISVEESTLNITSAENWQRVLKGRLVDAILAEHVMEHLTWDQIQIVLSHVARHLRPGGTFRMATPDGYHPSAYVQDLVRPGGLDIGSDDHKVLLNIDLLRQRENEVELQLEAVEYFDSAGTFHCLRQNWERGFIRRSSAEYRGRFTESAEEYQRMLQTTPAPLRQQFIDRAFSYTSLIVDWVRPGSAA